MAQRTLSVRQKQKYDTSTNWATNNPVLLAGEIGIESDTHKMKAGDGVTAWNSLDYIGPANTSDLTNDGDGTSPFATENYADKYKAKNLTSKVAPVFGSNSNFISTNKTWEGLTSFYGRYVWTDGYDIYYSNGSEQYVLDIQSSTWVAKEWNGLTSFSGSSVWSDGNNVYYSSGANQYVLDVSTSTWSAKTWSGITSFYGEYVWTDGENIYYNQAGVNRVLNKSTSRWDAKSWNISIQYANNIWTDGKNIYYSTTDTIKKHYKLVNGSWVEVTFVSGSSLLNGAQVWTDGLNVYSENYLIDTANLTVTRVAGLFGISYGMDVWTDGINYYYSNQTTQKVIVNAPTTKPALNVGLRTNPNKALLYNRIIKNKQDIISDLATIRSGASAGATALQPNDNISELVNDVGYLTSYTETDPTVPSWAKQANKPTYDYSEITNTPTIPTSINGMSGGTLTSPLIISGGDSATASKIILDNTKAGQITNQNTATLFGFTSNNATTLAVGHSSYALALRGSGTRPTFNSNSLALYSDIPSVPVTDVQLNGSSVVSSGVANVKALPNYSLSIGSTNGGNPRQVKFLSVNYTNYDGNNACFVKLGAMCSHGNGASYTFMDDIFIGVSSAGSVTCNVYKYFQQETTLDGVTRNYGDVFYTINTTNKVVDFYILLGQYSTANFTPYTKIGATTTTGITQYSGTPTYYSSGTKVWADGNSTTYARLSDIPTIPTVNDPTITITQGGVTKGSFTLNQASGDTIDLDAGGGGSETWTVLYDSSSDDPNINLGLTSGVRSSSGVFSALPDLNGYTHIMLKYKGLDSASYFVFDISPEDTIDIRLVQSNAGGSSLYFATYIVSVNSTTGKKELTVGNTQKWQYANSKVTCTSMRTDLTQGLLLAVLVR